VLLFGSAAKGELSKRSDIDIALVGPRNRRVLLGVFERIGGKYDLKIFEDLPLYIKIDIIKKHQIIFGDYCLISSPHIFLSVLSPLPFSTLATHSEMISCSPL